METCPVYNQQLDVNKFGKCKYYQGSTAYLLVNPTQTATTAYKYFNKGDCKWTERMFQEHFYKTRAAIQRNNPKETA